MPVRGSVLRTAGSCANGGGRGGGGGGRFSLRVVARRWRAARWRRVDGTARWHRVDAAREEGRRTHEELGPALAAARRRWARWAMVTRCAIPRRVRDRNLTWGRFRWPRWPTRALSLRVPGRCGCWDVDAAALWLSSTSGGCYGLTFA